MKKGFLYLMLALGCITSLIGCGTNEGTLDYADIYKQSSFDPNSNVMGGESLHYAADGYMGDVHPIYHEGKMYMFYMSTGQEKYVTPLQYDSLLAVSEDLIHYEKVSLIKDPDNMPDQDIYFVPQVYVDAQGRFRSCYGRSNYIGGCVSDDLITWGDGLEPYMNEQTGMMDYKYRVTFDEDVYTGRDPHIWYDKGTQSYYCVVLNYYTAAEAGGEKSLALYIGDQEGVYSSRATKLVSFTGRGDPECPQLIPIGNRWYLLYSVLGTGAGGGTGKFFYRVGEEGKLPQDVDWENAEEYCLDGGDLHAAQLVYVGEKLYMYGWINYEPNLAVWGGYINLPREIFQNADGTLGARCDKYLTELLKEEQLGYFATENTVTENLTVKDTTFTSNSEGSALLDGEYGRAMLTADITLPMNGEEVGITVTNNEVTYFVGLKRTDDGLFLTAKSGELELGSAYVKLNDPKQTEFSLKVILDQPFIEAFINDSYGVTAHTALGQGGCKLGLKLKGNGVAVEQVELYGLATYSSANAE